MPCRTTSQGELFRIAQEAIDQRAQTRRRPTASRCACATQDGRSQLSVSRRRPRLRSRRRRRAPAAGHFGLVGMRERAAGAGARSTMDSRPGRRDTHRGDAGAVPRAQEQHEPRRQCLSTDPQDPGPGGRRSPGGAGRPAHDDQTPSPTWRWWPRPATARPPSPPTPTHQPDVTLLDLRLPDMDGPRDRSPRIRKRDPDAQIIVLTSYDADEDVYRAVQAGARGYLLKGTFPDGHPGGHPHRARRPAADRPRGGRPAGRPGQQPRR